jgi:uncharacterized membrane protein SirB2
MNQYAIIQFFSLLIYIVLIGVVLQQKKTRLKNLFWYRFDRSSGLSSFSPADFTLGSPF